MLPVAAATRIALDLMAVMVVLFVVCVFMGTKLRKQKWYYPWLAYVSSACFLIGIVQASRGGNFETILGALVLMGGSILQRFTKPTTWKIPPGY